jgi:hypothetical protein
LFREQQVKGFEEQIEEGDRLEQFKSLELYANKEARETFEM